MILLVAVALGLAGGLLRARLAKRPLADFDIRSAWLVLAGYLPQFFAFFLPATRSAIPHAWVPPLLVGSQILLLIFAWRNRRLTGMKLLGLGLLANFAAIALNGGLMPLPPENARLLLPPGSIYMLVEGQRVGFGKDVLLARVDTRLWFLGDVLMLPAFFNYPLAFSIGDILISAGAFWLLFSLGSPRPISQEVSP
jgi:hypothetical protein